MQLAFASLMHAIQSGRRTHSRFAMMQPAREIAFPNRRDNSGGRGRAARAWRASGAVALNVVLVVPAVAIKVVPETSARHSSRADEQGDRMASMRRSGACSIIVLVAGTAVNGNVPQAARLVGNYSACNRPSPVLMWEG